MQKNLNSVLWLTLSLLAIATSVCAEKFPFTVNSNNFLIDIPDSFCIPDKGSDIADYFESLDRAAVLSNVSKNILHLYECEFDNNPSHSAGFWLRKFDGNLPIGVSASSLQTMTKKAYMESAGEIFSLEKVKDAFKHVKSETGFDVKIPNISIIEDTEFLTIGIVKSSTAQGETFEEFVLISHVFFDDTILYLNLSFDLNKLDQDLASNIDTLMKISHSVHKR